MANYQEYVTRIFLNSEQAENKIAKLRSNIEGYKKDKQAALDLGGKEGDKAWRKAEKDIRAAEKQIDQFSTTSQRVNAVLENLNTASVKDIQRTVKAINKELTSGSIERGSEEWKALTEQLKRAKTELKSIHDESKAADKLEDKSLFSKASDFLNRNWGAMTQAWSAFTGLSNTVRQATQAYADMEEAMANVRKYTGQTSEEIHSMNEEFKQIDTRTSREQLNELAGAAGRLGITAHDEIMDFVDAADKINVALGDDLGKGAVDQIGKLAMAFGEDDKMGLRKAMLSTGSAINELSANSSANAGYMVEFAARLAGVGKQAGLTQTQIYGLASVMDENLLQDEMASTALSQLITKMTTDTATFAQLAGVPLKEFSDMVKNDMNGALLTFFDAMKARGGFTEIAPMFEEMGLSGQRASSVLTVFADKIDDVRKNQQIANEAYKECTSVMDEYNVQNETVQAQVDKAKKRFNDLTVELGQKLMPVVKYTVTTGGTLVKLLSSLITFVSKHTAAVIGFASALAVAYIKQQLVNNATKIGIAVDAAHNALIRTKGVAVAVLSGKVSILTVAQHGLNAAMRAFPAVFVATAIAGIITVLSKLAIKIREAKREAHDTAAEDLGKTDNEQDLKKTLTAIVNEYNRDTKKLNNLIAKKQSLIKQGFKESALGGWNDQISELRKDLNERYKVIVDYKKKIASLRKRSKVESDKPDLPDFSDISTPPTTSTSGGSDPKEDQYAKELAAAKKHYKREATLETDKYNRGLEREDEYERNMATMKQQSYDEQLKIMEKYGKKETDDYKDLQTEQQTAETEANNKQRDLTLEQLERRYQSEQALLKAQLYDKTSEIYGDEEALNQALLNLDIQYLTEKQSHYLKTSDEYADIEAQKEQKLNDDKLAKAKAYEEAKAKLRREYVEQGGEEQEAAELAMLEEMYNNEEITYEEHLQAMMLIREKYAKHTPTASEQTKQTASASLSAAEKTVGDKPQYDTSGADMGVSSFAGIFQIVKYRQQVNEELKQLYGDDYKNSEEYNEAKKQNNQAMLAEIVSAAQAAYSGISQIMSAASAYSQACSDYETAKITADYDKQIEAAGNNSKKKERLEKERDKKLAAAKTKANKKAMKIEVAQAVASTAMAAINAYASASKISWVLGPIAAAMATAAGMLQIATIKKQHQAEEAGYYEGGFTSGRNYRRRAGVVHEGEFVANHNAVNNRSILPALQLIDQAQRNNTVSSLTAEDVSRAVGAGGSAAVVAPVVNVQTDNEQLNRTLGDMAAVVDSLNAILSGGINAKVGLDGPDGFDAQYRRYKRLKG